MESGFAVEVGCSLCFQVSVVILISFALQRWVNDARYGCRLWTASFVCIIGLVAAAFLLPHRRLLAFPDLASRDATLSVVVWQGWIVIAGSFMWAAGVTVSLLKRVILCAGLIRFLKNDCQTTDTEALLGRVSIETLEPPNVSILTSDRIQGPFCWQLHRPVIVLPAYLMTEDDTTLRHVLLHELEHLRTQHPMQHFLQGVCSTLFWFHPLVRAAARGAELTREYLCDEVAAKTAGKYGAYLRTLAKVAERCGSVSCTAVPKGTLAFGNQPSALVRRSNRLVELAEKQHTATRGRPVFAMVLLVMCAVMIQQLWLPTNAMASQRSAWSPWPTWTASALHQINVSVRDFESFEDRVQMHELLLKN